MSSLLRSLFVVLVLLSFGRFGVAQQLTVGVGEIRFDGTLISFDEAKKTLVLNVVSFTLPSGKSSKLAAPKPKTILLAPETQLTVAGKPGVQVAPLMQAGAPVVIIGKDAGSGKDVTARVVLVAPPTEAAAPAGNAEAAATGSDPNEVALRPGETRFDARLTGILSATNLTVSVFATTDANGETTELFPTETKTLVLDTATALRSRGDVARKLKFEDLKIGSRLTFSGNNTGAKIKAREVAIWEADNSSSESIGVVSVSGIVSRLLDQADQASDAGAYEEAVKILNRSLQAADGIGDRAGRGLTLSRLGNAYGELNQPQKAVAAFEGALATWSALGNTQSQSTTLNNLGILLRKHGQTDKAIEALERAVQLGRGGDPRGMALTLPNLASAYASAKKYDKALEALLEAMPFVRQTNKGPDREGILLARIGELYSETENPQKALEYAGQAEAMIDQMREKNGQAYAIYVIGSTYAQNGQKTKALELYKRAQALYTELEQKENVDDVAKAIADLEKPPAQ